MNKICMQIAPAREFMLSASGDELLSNFHKLKEFKFEFTPFSSARRIIRKY